MFIANRLFFPSLTPRVSCLEMVPARPHPKMFLCFSPCSQSKSRSQYISRGKSFERCFISAPLPATFSFFFLLLPALINLTPFKLKLINCDRLLKSKRRLCDLASGETSPTSVSQPESQSLFGESWSFFGFSRFVFGRRGGFAFHLRDR